MALPPEMNDTYRNYWSLVESAAAAVDEQGRFAYQVTDVVAAAADLARSAGQSLSFAQGSQISSLFALARGNVRASDTLASAGGQEPIGAGMIGEWPTAASADVQAAQAQYMAKGAFTYTNVLGEQAQGWITLTGISQLPSSVANLQLRMQGAAMSAYSKSPEEGGTPGTDAEVMAEFGDFTDLILYEV